MGAAASVDLPEEISVEEFEEMAGDRFSQELYEQRKSALLRVLIINLYSSGSHSIHIFYLDFVVIIDLFCVLFSR